MPRTPTARLMRSVSLLTLATTLGALPALSQETVATPEPLPEALPDALPIDETGAYELGKIWLTGENLERGIADTASSVSQLIGDELVRNKPQAASVAEAVDGVPNVTYPGTVSAPIIRGVDSQGPHAGANAFLAGTVPRATTNVDGHYLSFNENIFGAAGVWDVESIEVYRGPQTTSQGANAIAGAIIVNTKDPTFAPETAFRLETGSYNSRRAALAVSGALGADFAARLALDYSSRDTFIDYVNPNFAGDNNDQDFESFNGRLKLLWQPAEVPGLEAMLTYSHADSNRPTFEAASEPYEDLVSIAPTMPTWEQNTDTLIADVNYDFGNGMELFNQLQFSDTEAQRITGLVNQGDATIKAKNYSYEGRLTFGVPEDTLHGVVGVYVARTESDETLELRGNSVFDDTKTNLGLFGEATYRFNDQWSATAALRFQQDRIERFGDSVFTSIPADYDNTFEAILPKLSLAYQVTPDVVVGGLVSKGYNPGGVSLNFNSGVWSEFDAEESWNYELYTRATLLEDRLFLNANLFYTDYSNFQLNIPVEISPGVYQAYTINAEDTDAYGVEVALDYQVMDNLLLGFGAGYTKTDLNRVSGNPAYEGNQLPHAPELNISLSADWAVTDRFSLGGQLRYIQGYYTDLANTAALHTSSHAITDINASYAVNDNVEVYGYVSNLFDVREPLDFNSNRGTDGTYYIANMTAPRMVGIGLRSRF